MNTAKFKGYLLSKTIWAAVIGALLGAYQLTAPNYGWDTKWLPGAEMILGALGLYGLRTATTTLGKPTPGTADNIVPGPVSTPGTLAPNPDSAPDNILPPAGVIEPPPVSGTPEEQK